MTIHQVIVPAGHRVLIRPERAQKLSDIIEVVEDKKVRQHAHNKGTVVAVGADCWLAYRKVNENGVEVNGQPWAAVGDTVYYTRNAGAFIPDPNDPKNEEARFVILNDDDIQAVVKEINVED